MLPFLPMLVGTLATCDVLDLPWTDLKRYSCRRAPICKPSGIACWSRFRVADPIAILWHPVSMVPHRSSFGVSLWLLIASLQKLRGSQRHRNHPKQNHLSHQQYSLPVCCRTCMAADPWSKWGLRLKALRDHSKRGSGLTQRFAAHYPIPSHQSLILSRVKFGFSTSTNHQSLNLSRGKVEFATSSITKRWSCPRWRAEWITRSNRINNQRVS